MLLRKLKYSCMTMEQLKKELDRVSKSLNIETDSKKRMALVNAEFDMLEVIIHRGRKDKQFIQYVRTSMKELINETQQKLNN